VPRSNMSSTVSHASRSLSTPSRDAAGWQRLPSSYRIPEYAPSLPVARAYCERLARTHYENFSVATWFLPKRFRRHFYSIYAYCRISDDLGDEVGDPQQALELLDIWEQQLDATYESIQKNNSVILSGAKDPLLAGGLPSPASFAGRVGEGNPDGSTRVSPAGKNAGVPSLAHHDTSREGPRHPVFIALRETIRECDIPKQPFAVLLKAFRQDQTITHYETFDDLLGYCRYSADPVGRLVLYACGYRDEERQRLSDYTCTALQLANFWQDVALDYKKGRIYLPLESLRRFGVTEADVASRRFTPAFRELMRFEVSRAREWFERGLPLAKAVDRDLAIDIQLFTRGGQEILNAIERQDFDVLRSRPAISKPRKLWLVLRAAAGKLA
jgi:squalene synthase HpnC